MSDDRTPEEKAEAELLASQILGGLIGGFLGFLCHASLHRPNGVNVKDATGGERLPVLGLDLPKVKGKE